MKYALIVSDIDGTLINRRQQLLKETQEVIDHLTGQGIRFATASARTRRKALEITSRIQSLCSAFAHVNGAYVETSTNEILCDRPVAGDTVRQIVAQSSACLASICQISVDDATAVVRHDECYRAFRLIDDNCRFSKTPAAPPGPVYGLMIYAESILSLRETLVRTFPGLDISPVAAIRKYNRGYIFVHAGGVNKGSALRLIAGHFGIDMQATVAFGDSLSNDSSLLECSGWGVAMKNASPQLQAMADSITRYSNDQDGVGDYLRRLYYPLRDHHPHPGKDADLKA